MDFLDTDYNFSQPDPECFLVKDSQEETQELNDPVKMLEKLPALRRVVSQDENKNYKQPTRSSPRRKNQSPVVLPSSPKRSGLMSIRQALKSQVQQKDSSSSEDNGVGDDIPANIGNQGQGGNQGEGDGGEAPLGGDDGDVGGAGGGGGGAGGNGGDGGNGGNHGGDNPDDGESEEENDQEEDHPSSSDSNSVPNLIPAPSGSSAFTPPRHIPGHYEGQGSSPRPGTSARHSDDSNSEGGISTASTAVVSDTEGRGQIFERRGRRLFTGSPARSSGAPISPRRAGGVHDTGSAVSTLSSYSSSSASEEQASPQAKLTGKKRAASRRLPLPPSKRTRVDTSSSTTSPETKKTNTSSSSTKTTTTDSSTDTSCAGDMLQSGERAEGQAEEKEHEEREDVNPSQQDMFSQEPGSSKDQNPGDDERFVSTPAELLESLNFSGQQSAHQIQSLGYVPASQDAFSGSIPFIIPGSPTADTSGEESGNDSFRAELGGIRKLTKKSSFEIREERRQMPPPSFETPESLEVVKRVISTRSPKGSPIPEESKVEEDPKETTSQGSEGVQIQESEAWNLHLQATEQATCVKESQRSYVKPSQSRIDSQALAASSQASEDPFGSLLVSATTSQHKSPPTFSQETLRDDPSRSSKSTSPEDNSQKQSRRKEQWEENQGSLPGRKDLSSARAVRKSQEKDCEDIEAERGESPEFGFGGSMPPRFIGETLIEENDPSEALALHLSQSQNTQSQYSVGVREIIQLLDEEGASQQSNANLAGDDPPSPARAESLAELSLPAPSHSQLETTGVSLQSQSDLQIKVTSSESLGNVTKEQSRKIQTKEQSLREKTVSVSSRRDTLEDDDDTQGSVSIFSLKRPNIETDPMSQQADQSVFKQVKKAREEREVAANRDESEDPFVFIDSQGRSTPIPSTTLKPRGRPKKNQGKAKGTTTPLKTQSSEGYHSLKQTQVEPDSSEIIVLSQSSQEQSGYTLIKAVDVVQVSSQSSQEIVQETEEVEDTCTNTGAPSTNVEIDQQPQAEKHQSNSDQKSQKNSDTVGTKSQEKSQKPSLRQEQPSQRQKGAGQSQKEPSQSQKQSDQSQKKQTQPFGVQMENPTVLVPETETSSLKDSQESMVISSPLMIPDSLPQQEEKARKEEKMETGGDVVARSSSHVKSQPDTLTLSGSGKVHAVGTRGHGHFETPRGTTPRRRAHQKKLKSTKVKKDGKEKGSHASPAVDRPSVPNLRPQDTLIGVKKNTMAGGSNSNTPKGTTDKSVTGNRQQQASTSGHTPGNNGGQAGGNLGVGGDGDGPQAGVQHPGMTTRYLRMETHIRNVNIIQQDVVNGQVVSDRVIRQQFETMSTNITSLDDSLSTPSPSRQTQSLTSGDLADISSMSRSTSSKTGTGSSFNSPHPPLGSSSSHSGSHISTTLVPASSTPSVIPSSLTQNKNVTVSSATEMPRTAAQESSTVILSGIGSAPPVDAKTPSLEPNFVTPAGHISISSDGIAPSGEQTILKSPSHNDSSSSYLKPEDLDTSIEKLLPMGKSTSHSSGLFSSISHSTSHSTSLFSGSISPEGVSGHEGQNQSKDKGEFQRPQPPGAPRRTVATKEPPEMIPEQSPKLLRKDEATSTPKGKGRGKAQIDNEPAGVSQDPSLSTPMSTSSTPRQQAPPAAVLKEGTPVFAMWKDKFYYHGKTTGSETLLKIGVAFDDGNMLNVAKTNVIASDVLTVGHTVMAEEEGDYSLPATVVGVHNQDEFDVKFEDNSTKRVSVEKLSLSSEQFQALKTHLVSSIMTTDTTAPATAETSESSAEPSIQKKEEKVQHSKDKAVYAMYLDKYFYPGYIVCVEEGRYTIAFEDGDSRQVRNIDVIHCDLLPLGQDVFAMGESEHYVRARIIEVFDGSQEDWGYKVEFLDGEPARRLRRCQVILSHEQGACLLQDRVNYDTTPKMADLSLNNLVDGKRRRLTPQINSPKTPTTSSPSTRNRAQRKLPWTTGGKRMAKRTLASVEPTATSTPTPKRYKALTKSQMADSEAPSPLISGSPHKTGTASPKKYRQELFSEKGPVPKIGSDLFQGKCFFLTNVVKAASPSKSSDNRTGSNMESDESSIELLKDNVDVPFDQKHLELQITNGGGTVLTNFDRDRVKLYSEAFLISRTFHRTAKYLHCLAAGIPCVSHVWIRDVCTSGTLTSHIPYILPAGVSIETGKVIEWRNTPSMPLKGKHLVVSTSNKKFVKKWSEILRSAGCFVDNSLPEEIEVVNAVVTDQGIKGNTCYSALQADIPVVSSEWVIESLITGKQASYDGHARYRHETSIMEEEEET